MKHIVPISGKDSLATAIILRKQSPEIDFEYIFNPVGLELPETIEWLNRVEVYLGTPIIKIGVDLTELPEWKKGFRPSQIARFCTRKGKLIPTEEYFKGEGFIYYGLRYDEPERIGYINKGKSELTPVYPLRENKIDLVGVMQICSDVGLNPPAFRWSFFEKEFTERLGADFIYSKLNAWQIDQLFAWRKRNNCYRCFNMARYEWVGLHDHHPDLFWSVVADEENKDLRENNFTVIKGLPLRELLKRRKEILENHINKTVKALSAMKQSSLFDNEIFTDFLSLTSCGLLCGK